MVRRGTAKQPILVTGVPRSGTTWLARWLAMSSGVALPGREPMNARGRNYALAGTLTGWARVTRPTPKQLRALTWSYHGLNPLVYSRYGTRQWAAPLPWTRLVVKDPFALLSIPAVVQNTGAVPLVVYRHPGAVLTSYRRMGWRPDLDELRPIAAEASADGADTIPELGPQEPVATAENMARFWSALHEIALSDLERAGIEPVVVAHHELASSATIGREVAERVGLPWTEAMEHELLRQSGQEGSPTALHNFDRAPAQVAEAWRARLEDAEVTTVEQVAAATLERLASLRVGA